jgi:hypothetical protein
VAPQLGSRPTTVDQPAPRRVLAGFRLPLRSWERPLAQALAEVLSRPPAGADVFRRTLSFCAFYAHELLKSGGKGNLVKTGPYRDEYPVASTLVALEAASNPLDRTLAWLLLEFHLDGASRPNVEALAETVRGLARQTKENQLRYTIGAVDGVSQLIAKMNALDQGQATITGHVTFDRMWRSWLGVACQQLLAFRDVAEGEEDVDSIPLACQRRFKTDPPRRLKTDPGKGRPREVAVWG